jgi:hypothetical protein
MAIKRKSNVKANETAKEVSTEKKVVKKPSTTKATSEKSTAKKTTAVKKPATKSSKDTAKTKKPSTVESKKEDGGAASKKLKSLSRNNNEKVVREHKKGTQATQDYFNQEFMKNLNKEGFEPSSLKDVALIKKAYSETLKDILANGSYQDSVSGIYYAYRTIKSRVTNPPQQAVGEQTLMKEHHEIKVRMIVEDEKDIKFLGKQIDDNTFEAIIVDEDGNETTTEIAINDEKPKKKSTSKKTVSKKKPSKVEDEEEEEIEETEDEDIEEDDIEEDVEEEEIEEDLDDEDEDSDDEEDDEDEDIDDDDDDLFDD